MLFNQVLKNKGWLCGSKHKQIWYICIYVHVVGQTRVLFQLRGYRTSLIISHLRHSATHVEASMRNTNSCLSYS